MSRTQQNNSAESAPLLANRRSGKLRTIPLGIICGAVALIMVAALALSPRWTTNRVSPRYATTGETTDHEATEKLDVLEISSIGQQSWNERDDPLTDGWQTETFHLRAKAQLKKLGKLLVGSKQIEEVDLASLVSEEFSCWPLQPRSLQTVFRDKALHVERATLDPESTNTQSPGPYWGPHGLAEALRELARPFRGAKDLRFEFKLFHVQPAADSVTTRQYIAISGRTASGVIEQHATWSARWASGLNTASPRLNWIGVEDFEQVRSKNAQETLFSDCTESVLAGNACYKDQFLRGFEHWLERTQDIRYFALLGNPGVAIGDVNGDGLDDIYICQESGLPNRLFIQNPDGSVRDISEWAGVDWLENSRSALLVDLDNDGDQDLAVAFAGGVVLAEGDGRGRFTVRTVVDISDDTMSISAADYDDDGRLDLYACVYYPNDFTDGSRGVAIASAAESFVLHDANDAGSNSLLRNEITGNGTWRFVDVTKEVGLDTNNRRYSFAAAWDDFDNDGDLDVYVANDYGRDNLYRNQLTESGTATFVDVSDDAHIENSAGGMSITCSDYDRDGWMDVFVSNMWSAAGNRITFQDQFKAQSESEVKRRLQRFARGNTLLRNLGDGTFEDRSAPAAVEMGRWAWGSHFIDINNDGWEDVLVSNGYITTEDTRDL